MLKELLSLFTQDYVGSSLDVSRPRRWAVDDSYTPEEPSALPRLPSVRELATLFQPKASPEPLPRRSLLKVMLTEKEQSHETILYFYTVLCVRIVYLACT